MPRITFNGKGALQVDDADLLVGLTDLAIDSQSGRPVLYAAARGGGSLTQFSLGDGASPATLQSSWTIPEAWLQLESSEIALINGPEGLTDVMIAGLADQDLHGRVDTGSALGGARIYDAGAFDLGLISEISVAPDGVRALAALRGGGLAQLTFATNGQISATIPVGQGALALQRASDVSWVDLGGDDGAVVSYSGTDQVALLRMDGSGRMSLVDVVGSAEGAWIDSPGEVATITGVDGVAYAVVAASGSSSLTVMALEGNNLRPVDHLVDDLDTRFYNADHVTAVEIAGQPFIVAAGSDQGLTVLSLLPGGQLIEVASLPASVETPLNGIAALDVVAVGDTARIFVATHAAPFLVEFEFSLDHPGISMSGDGGANVLEGSAEDDFISGGAGNDTLNGGAGEDVVADGAGVDVLTGGVGRDIFVLTADGEIDRITDFQRGEDRIQLQGSQPGLGTDDIQVLSRSWGAEVHIGAEVLHVYSADSAPLSWSDFGSGGLAMSQSISTRLSGYPDDGSDYGPENGSDLDATLRFERPSFEFATFAEPFIDVSSANAQIGGTIQGGAGSDLIIGVNDPDILIGAGGFDTIIGHGGNDTISGGEQSDSIQGRSGDDVISGGTGFDQIWGDAGNDRIWGGSDPDRIWGGDGNDWIDAGFNYGPSVDGVDGGAGNDTIFGGVGYDLLIGGTGDDSIDGGHQADNIYGDDGADMLYGNAGFDRLFGGAGDDLLYGGEGPDTHFGHGDNDRMWGGDGNDRFYGGSGNDYIAGEAGNDTLGGNAGFDTLIGGAGDDLLYGDFNADRFVFDDGHGHDTIVGFDAGNVLEILDFSGLNLFTGTSDVMARSQQVGNNVEISTGLYSSITLVAVDIGDLDGTDFLF